jgi:hypothetical protein
MDLLLKSEVVSTARTRNICGFATSMAPRPNQVARADAILKTQGTRKAPLGIERHFNDFASPNKPLRLLTRSRPSERTRNPALALKYQAFFRLLLKNVTSARFHPWSACR